MEYRLKDQPNFWIRQDDKNGFLQRNYSCRKLRTAAQLPSILANSIHSYFYLGSPQVGSPEMPKAKKNAEAASAATPLSVPAGWAIENGYYITPMEEYRLTKTQASRFIMCLERWMDAK